MVGGIRFEHTHRMIAATVGLLTMLLTAWILFTERRRWVRNLSLAALGAVILQGLLGGLTVLWQLPPAVSVTHACVGQAFFAMVVVLATTVRPEQAPHASLCEAKRAGRVEGHPWGILPRLALLTMAAIYLQLILGSILRHTGWRPHLLAGHIFWALVVFALIMKSAGGVLRAHRNEPALARPAKILIWLLLLQMGLGLATMIRGGEVFVATAHVAVGALLLATSAVLTVRLFKMVPGTKPKNVPGTYVDYLELTKPRLTGLAVATSLIGFLLGSTDSLQIGKLLVVLIGTALTGGGAGALNQYLEKEEDAQMQRTKGRPLPSGRIDPESALMFGVVLSILGLGVLTFGANPLSGTLAVLTLGSYLFLYTPLKRRTALCTLVGAIPGALPPLIGWAAARASLGLEAWLLFSILFLWQLPHFLAIAWIYRDDYARAGFKMLPVLDPEGGLTSRQITLYCLALVPVSLFPTVFGFAGIVYFLGALVSSLAFLRYGLVTARLRSGEAAHRLFLASVMYLPWILFTMTLDRVIS